MKLRSAAATAAAPLLLVLGSAASAQAVGPEKAVLKASDATAKTAIGLGSMLDQNTKSVLGPGPVVDTDTSKTTASALGLARQNPKHAR